MSTQEIVPPDKPQTGSKQVFSPLRGGALPFKPVPHAAPVSGFRRPPGQHHQRKDSAAISPTPVRQQPQPHAPYAAPDAPLSLQLRTIIFRYNRTKQKLEAPCLKCVEDGYGSTAADHSMITCSVVEVEQRVKILKDWEELRDFGDMVEALTPEEDKEKRKKEEEERKKPLRLPTPPGIKYLGPSSTSHLTWEEICAENAIEERWPDTRPRLPRSETVAQSTSEERSPPSQTPQQTAPESAAPESAAPESAQGEASTPSRQQRRGSRGGRGRLRAGAAPPPSFLDTWTPSERPTGPLPAKRQTPAPAPAALEPPKGPKAWVERKAASPAGGEPGKKGKGKRTPVSWAKVAAKTPPPPPISTPTRKEVTVSAAQGYDDPWEIGEIGEASEEDPEGIEGWH